MVSRCFQDDNLFFRLFFYYYGNFGVCFRYLMGFFDFDVLGFNYVV